MSSILKMSGAASLALHTAIVLAAVPDGLISTKRLASLLGASEAHLSKVLQRLEKANLVNSMRGPKGGFRLSRSGDEIMLIDVYEAIDGKLSISPCLLLGNVCDGSCGLGNMIANLNTQFKDYLSRTNLSNLSGIYRSMKEYEKKHN